MFLILYHNPLKDGLFWSSTFEGMLQNQNYMCETKNNLPDAVQTNQSLTILAMGIEVAWSGIPALTS